jgi:hypothetical protein
MITVTNVNQLLGLGNLHHQIAHCWPFVNAGSGTAQPTKAHHSVPAEADKLSSLLTSSAAGLPGLLTSGWAGGQKQAR